MKSQGRELQELLSRPAPYAFLNWRNDVVADPPCVSPKAVLRTLCMKYVEFVDLFMPLACSAMPPEQPSLGFLSSSLSSSYASRQASPQAP
jgi:hypothetical protein